MLRTKGTTEKIIWMEAVKQLQIIITIIEEFFVLDAMEMQP